MYIYVRAVFSLHYKKCIQSFVRCDAVQLQQPIDNADGDLYIDLKSINYTIGFFNIINQVDGIVLWDH